MGKLHRERAVTRRIFQALPTQTNRQTPPLLLLYIRFVQIKVVNVLHGLLEFAKLLRIV
jgi:hypothetical protein